jgi:hypothetical protein
MGDVAIIRETAYHRRVAIRVNNVELTWRPELRFYEARSALLRNIDDAGLLDAFIWNEGSIAMRIGPFSLLYLDSTRLRITLTSPTRSPMQMEFVIDQILDFLRPRDVGLGVTRHQSLFAIGEPAKMAQARTASFLPGSASEVAGFTDWAVLVDGRSATSGAGFQIEYGILGPHEIESRLLGRAHSFGNSVPSLLELPVDEDALPEDSFYTSCLWQPITAVDDKSVTGSALGLWKMLEEQSIRLSQEIAASLRLDLKLGDATEAMK